MGHAYIHPRIVKRMLMRRSAPHPGNSELVVDQTRAASTRTSFQKHAEWGKDDSPKDFAEVACGECLLGGLERRLERCAEDYHCKGCLARAISWERRARAATLRGFSHVNPCFHSRTLRPTIIQYCLEQPRVELVQCCGTPHVRRSYGPVYDALL